MKVKAEMTSLSSSLAKTTTPPPLFTHSSFSAIYFKNKITLNDYESLLDLCEENLLPCVKKAQQSLSSKDLSSAFIRTVDRFGAKAAIDAFAAQYWNTPIDIINALSEDHIYSPKGDSHEVKRIATYYHQCSGGGAENVLVSLVNIWKKMNYRIVVFLDELPAKDSPLPSDIDIVVLPSFLSLNSTNYHERSEALIKAFEKYHIDTVVYHAWLNECLLWDMLIAKSLNIKFYIYCHGSFSYLLHDALERFEDIGPTYSLADGVLTLNNADAAFFKVFNPNVFLAKNPIPNDLPTNRRSNLRNKTVLWLGRLSPEKHPEEAINIFELVYLQNPNAKFALVGDSNDPSYRDSIISLIKAKGLEQVIEVPGWENGERKYNRYLQARVFLMTSSTEGFPLTLVESKAFGLPCVMYDLPHLDLAKDGKGIVSVPFNNAHLAAAAINELLENNSLAEEMGTMAAESFSSLIAFNHEEFWNNVFSLEKKCETITSTNEQELIRIASSAYRYGIRHKNIEINRLYSSICELSEEIRVIKESSIWQVGKIVTAIPRFAKTLITGLKDKMW